MRIENCNHISASVDAIRDSVKTVHPVERERSCSEEKLSENEFDNNAKGTVAFYNIPKNTPGNYVQSEDADNNATQLYFKICASVKSILDVRPVGKMD